MRIERIERIKRFQDTDKKNTTTCIIRGREYYYDACSSSGKSDLYKNMIYLGAGHVNTVNGIKQSGDKKEPLWHFYAATKRLVK